MNRVATVAACMARNCTPEQTDKVMEELANTRPAWQASAIQRQLDDAINRAKGTT
jgi:hypothetical protein